MPIVPRLPKQPEPEGFPTVDETLEVLTQLYNNLWRVRNALDVNKLQVVRNTRKLLRRAVRSIVTHQHTDQE